jgi:hypothetical protein
MTTTNNTTENNKIIVAFHIGRELNLQYTVVKNQIVYKGTLGQHKTLVGLLVSEAIKRNIQVW